MNEKDDYSSKNDIQKLRNIYNKYDSGQINDKELKNSVQRVMIIIQIFYLFNFRNLDLEQVILEFRKF